jgi:hypothetical protein
MKSIGSVIQRSQLRPRDLISGLLIHGCRIRLRRAGWFHDPVRAGGPPCSHKKVYPIRPERA